MPFAFIDFLNNREDAAVIWAAALLVVILVASRGKFFSSLGGLVEVLFPKLLLVFGGAAAYTAAVVYVAALAGLWHRDTLKETVYWFVAAGLVMTSLAIEKSPEGFGYLGGFLGRAVRITVVAEFVVNLYVFPLLVELFLLPVL